MNKRLIPLIFILSAFGAASSFSQETGVRSEYDKDANSTKVETNMLYVGNTVDQFVEIRFSGSFQGEKLASPPKIQITINSFSKAPLFKKDKDRSLVIVSNSEEANVGTMTDTVFKGETKDGVDNYVSVNESTNAEIQVPLPKGASIRAEGSMTGMTLEILTLQLKPEQFVKLASAASVRFKIGSIILTPTQKQTEVIHNFAERMSVKP